MEKEQTNIIWKEIEGHPYYYVSNTGLVYVKDRPVWCKANNSYSIRKGHFCKPTYTNSKHYARVGLQVNNKQKWFQLHRLVAAAFIPNPNNLPQVNHIDGNKANNNVSNLEWVTNSENMQKSWETGLRDGMRKTMSLNAPQGILKKEDVAFIRDEFKDVGTKYESKNDFYRKMAKRFGLKSKNTIFWIVRAKRKTHQFI